MNNNNSAGLSGDQSEVVLITGGAGFIGSHLADELIARGHRVRALDSLHPQVHGRLTGPPDYLNPDAEFLHGDVCDPAAVRRALEGARAVFHLAAAVGVGQSMYEIQAYTRANNLGTATLLEALIERARAGRPIQKLVVASSMSVYGEGLYHDAGGAPFENAGRAISDLANGIWDPVDDKGWLLRPAPTPESKPPSLSSIYALSKYDQERMCLLIGQAYQIPTVALRFFNVYGTRQALSNPYTGVLAIFASRLLNGNAPLIYEDGAQLRDFVSVRDVARACALALESPAADGLAINIGSGRPRSITQVARLMSSALGREDLQPVITGKHRKGDVRHCFADISLARRALGFEPGVALENGVDELASWLERQRAEDLVDKAHAELHARGLTV